MLSYNYHSGILSAGYRHPLALIRIHFPPSYGTSSGNSVQDPESKPHMHLTLTQIITMAPRSQLEITTSSVTRLVKEEASYHKELQQQTERIKKLEADTAGDDENREYTLKQEVCALYGSFASTKLSCLSSETSNADMNDSTCHLKRPRRSCLL